MAKSVDNEEELNPPIPGQTSFWSVHDSFRAGLRDEPRSSRSTSKPSGRGSSAPKRAQEAVQLQVRQLELKQLELQVKLKRRLEEQAKEAKEALSAKQQQIERLKQHAFLEAREKQRGLSLKREGASRSGSASPRSGPGSPGSRSFDALAAEELSVVDSEEREARQADRARKVEKERERVAWRAMQEEAAEKRKAMAKEEAAKKEQAARKIQALRSASAHQRSQARAFGEARKTEQKKAEKPEKGLSQVPQKVQKVAAVEREPSRTPPRAHTPPRARTPQRARTPPRTPPRVAAAPPAQAARVETPRSRGRWTHGRSDSPTATSRSRASTPETKSTGRRREGHWQATQSSEARVIQKSDRQGHSRDASPPPSPPSPLSPSSRSQSPRPRSPGGSPARPLPPGKASPSPTPRKEGLDPRPPWLPVGQSKSQQELAGGRQWWESNGQGLDVGDFLPERRQIKQAKPLEQYLNDSKAPTSEHMEVTFGAPAVSSALQSRGPVQDPAPWSPRAELRMQQIPGQPLNMPYPASLQDLAASAPRQQLHASQYSPQKDRNAAVPRPAWNPADSQQRYQDAQNAWWVDLQGSYTSLPSPSPGASPTHIVSEPIERSLASQQPHFPSHLQSVADSYGWSASPASAAGPAPYQDAPRLGDHFAERLGLDVGSPGPKVMPAAIPAEVWQQRVRQADHQLLSLRQARSQSGSPSRSSPSAMPRSVSPRRSPAFGTSDPIIPALKIVQKYSDYFVASPSHTPRSAGSNASRSPRSNTSRSPRTPRSPRNVSPPNSPGERPARLVQAKAASKPKASKANGVVYPRSKELLSWQAAGFQAAGSSYRGIRDAAGLKDGWGMLNQKDGTTYAGQWVSGKRHGAGTLMFDGGIFEGQWARGEATGSGIVRFHNGDKFEGQYVSNRKHGFGVYSWADGAMEEGQYFNGQKDDWHVWSKGASVWNLRYESGALVEALQVKGKKKETPRSLPYPRAKESNNSSRQPSPRSAKAAAKASVRPKAKVASAKARVRVLATEERDLIPFASDLMSDLQPQQPAEPAGDAEPAAAHRNLEVALPQEAHQTF